MQGSDGASGAGLLFKTSSLSYFSFIRASLFDVTGSLDSKQAPSYLRRAPFQARPCFGPRAAAWTSHLDIVVLAVLSDPLQACVAVQQRAAAGGDLFLEQQPQLRHLHRASARQPPDHAAAVAHLWPGGKKKMSNTQRSVDIWRIACVVDTSDDGCRHASVNAEDNVL